MKYIVIILFSFLSLPTFTSKAITNANLEVIAVDKVARVTCYSDFGATASGEITRPGIVATSDRSIPMGTKIYIEGYGEMLIADKTAQWVHDQNGLTFDIWDKDCDRTFGVKKLTYKILE